MIGDSDGARVPSSCGASMTREHVLLVPQSLAEDVKRITRTEAVLTLDDIDRHRVTTVLGKGTAQAMKARR